ncbi:MAG TPA: hypothetical protein VKT17_11085 [Acidobacteriota bacterium]|nr:hypothetical protein [Acidobacteriota bacterium]
MALLPVVLSRAQAALPQKVAPTSPQSVTTSLDALLAKASEYCRKLESSAFDFVCREEIRETIDPKLDAAQKRGGADLGELSLLGPGAANYFGPTLTISTVRKIKRSFVYDYQCIRAGRAIREIRDQLEENGKRKNVPHAELQTSIVVFGTALLAPIGLFGERFQPGYDFTIAGHDRIDDIPVVIVDAKPKPGTPASRNLYGRSWVDPVSGDILKIEWSEDRVGNFDVFAKRGRIYKRTPRLDIRSEFSAEKNGIRFPSRLSVDETYLNDSGKAFVRSKTEVVYKDFKFFTVEFDVRD